MCKKKEIEQIKQENIEIKNELKYLKSQLSLFLDTKCKMHPKTLQKINKTLEKEDGAMHNSKIIKNTSMHGNNNTMNINNINKNTCIQNINHYHQTNHIHIVELGKENVNEIFSDKIQKAILRKRYNSLNTLIKLLHYGKFSPQCHNIIITNVNNNVAYSYNARLNRFTAVNKNDLLERLIEFRKEDLEEMYAKHKDKMSQFSRDCMEQFFEDMKEVPNSKKKKNEIKLLCYNGLEYILKKYKNVE